MLRAGEIKSTRLPLTAIEAPYMLAALARWRAAAGEGMLPSEHAIKPLELAEAAGYTGLIDVLRGPLDFRFRYFGSRMAAAIGADYTGRRVSELEPLQYIGLLMEGYVSAANGREPVLHHLAMHLDTQRQWSYQRLLLPLSHSGGGDTDTIWAVTHYGSETAGKPAL
ncbi:MAG: PAS domain-containing protein [Stellaceae bacterium]